MLRAIVPWCPNEGTLEDNLLRMSLANQALDLQSIRDDTDDFGCYDMPLLCFGRNISYDPESILFSQRFLWLQCDL